MSKSSELDKVAKQYIIDCIDPEAYEIKAKTDAEKVRALNDAFNSEYGHEIKRKGPQTALAEYFMGLPTICTIDYEWYKIIELAKQWGSIPEDATEKQEDKICDNWFNFIANKTLQLVRKHSL